MWAGGSYDSILDVIRLLFIMTYILLCKIIGTGNNYNKNLLFRRWYVPGYMDLNVFFWVY